MREIITNLAVNIGQTANTSELQPGMRDQGWRLWDGQLLVTASAGDVTVELRKAITGEVVDTVTVVGGADKSGNYFKIPGVYTVHITAVATANAVVSVYLDGDTGRSPETVTVA